MIGIAINQMITTGTYSVAPTGCYPETAPQGTTLPFILYDITDLEPSPTKDRISALDTFFVTLNCFGKTQIKAQTLAKEVRDNIDGLKDQTYTAGGETIVVQSVTVTSSDSTYADEIKSYIASMNVKIRVIR